MKFGARERFEFSNGAIGWRPGHPFDCLGPFARVDNCPVDGTSLKVTAYATGYADTFFSVPARCSVKGHYIGGYLTMDGEGGVRFVPYDRFRDRLTQ